MCAKFLSILDRITDSPKDFLQQKSGTKEGQVQMIREEDGSVTAHTWSSAAQQWINVGYLEKAPNSRN